jgi:ABC-type Na+ transport system ATPase subunit NatA
MPITFFKPQDIQEASEMAHAMGMTGAEAAKITKISTTNGKSLRENNEAIVDSVNSFNKQNKTAVMSSKIFKDIANVSDEIAIIYTGYPEKLASAATTANSIGMELGDVAKIASHLLDFESIY